MPNRLGLPERFGIHQCRHVNLVRFPRAARGVTRIWKSTRLGGLGVPLDDGTLAAGKSRVTQLGRSLQLPLRKPPLTKTPTRSEGLHNTLASDSQIRVDKIG
jgi:hypothetical protein